jgi:hypothetical protein
MLLGSLDLLSAVVLVDTSNLVSGRSDQYSLEQR